MAEYLLAGSALLACLGAGTAGVQGVQMARYRGEGLNVVLGVLAAVAALAGAALFVGTLRSPAAFFTALRHASSGIAIYLYATLALVVACGVAVVLAKRSEDASVPRWVGVMLVAVAAVLVFGAALGFLKSAFVKVDGRFWAAFALFVGLALCLGSFVQLMGGILAGNDGARSFGRTMGFVGAVALVVGAAVFAGWLLAGSGAGAAGATKTAFSFDGYTVNMGAAASATATDRLAALAAGDAVLFWAGALGCGLALPPACGIGALVGGARPGVQRACGAVGLSAALVGGYCLCLVVGMLV